MDLALELGMPLATIGRMPEREFVRWAKYASQKGFPMRRLEYYLAQIAQLIVITSGSKASISDFLIPTRDDSLDPDEPPPPPTKAEIAALRAEIGFKPRGKPRRKKVSNG